MWKFFSGMRAGLQRFWKASGGNTAMMFGLALVPLVISTGAAIDASRALIVRARLAEALDAAGLAVGGATELSEEDMEALAQDFFDANYPDTAMGIVGALHVSVNGDVIDMSATATVPTTILQLAHIDHVNVGVSNQITRESTGLEVVLVLDNTGSMGSNGKIGALRTAASELINILFGDDPNPELVTGGLVPFVTGVNIMADGAFDMSWIDVDAESAYHGENFDEENGHAVSHLDLFDRIPNSTWRGCVEARPYPYDVNDAAPTASNPDTLFVPYFWPDEPDDGSNGYNNDYLNDSITNNGGGGGGGRGRGRGRGGWGGGWGGGNTGGLSGDQTQRDLTKYNLSNYADVDETPSNTSGPNMSCPDPLVPLTNDRDLLLDRIDDMEPWNNSGTNVAHGLSWGWRVLSPGEPFTEGAAYSDRDTQKALILLTDGVNTLCCQINTHNSSDYGAYGYVNEHRLGTSSPNYAPNIVDDRVAELCENIKDEGIRVYTITFQVNNSRLSDLFEGCASSPDLYFNSPSNEDLQNVFRTIGRDLSNLRLSR